MIRILWREGRSAPVVVCDVCGDAIWDWHEGAAVFGDAKRDNEKVEVLHAHKDKCHDIAETRIGDNWQELGAHLYWLCCNLQAGTPEQYGELRNLFKDAL